MEPKKYDVAYLVSHYPKVSHSFIRREILELERRGLRILRLSIRGWDVPVVDPEDQQEHAKTTFVLQKGSARLAFAMILCFLTRPNMFVRAVRLAVEFSRGADRPFIWHLIYLAEACWISRHLALHNISHIHAHFGTNPAEVAALVSAVAPISFSITIHGPEEFDKVHSVHIAEKVKRSAFTVAISSFCRSQIYRVLEQNDWTKVKVVHCGIDDDFSKNPEPLDPLSNRLVCVGRLTEQKGQLLLVEVVAELLRDGRDLTLVLVGDGELRTAIEKMIADHGISHAVQITGWATALEVREQILQSRALIMPSFAEGLPVVLMEAMALRRPVLSTYVNGIPELVIPGATGWLFPAGSKSDMKEAIEECLAVSHHDLQEMGDKGRVRALGRHNTSTLGLKMTELFKEILNQTPCVKSI